MRPSARFVLAAAFSTTFGSVAFAATPATAPAAYGKPVPAAAALSVSTVLGLSPRLADQAVQVEGKVSGVCKREGCWVTLKDPAQQSDETLRVIFKDHAFTVPVELAGRTVVAVGVLRVTETSVERLRHLAEDAGQSAAQIAAITAPRHEATLEADGLKVVGDAQ